jgi:inhibitor of cysteine peptidase
MKKLAIAFSALILMAAAMITGCATKVEAYTDPGTVVNAGLNQEFTLALGSNISTGYSWQPAFDPNVLNLVNKEYKNGDNANGKIVGAPGVEYFTFKALKTGETKITLRYWRPWEPTTPQDKQQSFTINVK